MLRRRSRSNKSPRHEDDQHDDQRGSRSENVLNSVRVQIGPPPPPSRQQPHSQHTSPTQTTATATSTTFNRQERARQKLDNLSRQHQLHQREQQQRLRNNHQYYASTAITVATPNTFTTAGEGGEGTATADYCSTTTATADTSDTTTLQLQSNYNSLMNSNSNNVYRVPIISTAAACGMEENIITPRPISCNNVNDIHDGNTAQSSLQSSYYSKHDFHTLPRKYTRNLNELDVVNNDANNATATNAKNAVMTTQPTTSSMHMSKQQNQQQQQQQPKPRVCILHASTDYSPKPPSKRSTSSSSGGGFGSLKSSSKKLLSGSGGRPRQLEEEEEERNQVKDYEQQHAKQQQQQQQQNHDFDYQPTPPSKRSSGYLLGRSSRIGKAEERRKYKISHTKQQQQQQQPVQVQQSQENSVALQSRQTNAKGIEHTVKIGDKNNVNFTCHDADDDVELNYDHAVTTPTKPMELSMEKGTNDGDGGSNDNALLQSTTPDTSYDNIWSLPAAAEVTPSPTKSNLRESKQQKEKEEPKQRQPLKSEKRSQTSTPPPNASSTVVDPPAPSSTAPTAKIGNNSHHILNRLLRRHQKSKPRSAMMQTFQQMKQQVDDDEERERDGLEMNKARMENVQTNKSVGGEPPEEENISLRPDPPPDPPEQHVGQQPRATYKHYNSKVMEHTQSIQQHQPQQPPAEYRHFKSTVLERSRSQPQFTNASSSSKPKTTNKKNSTTTELQPPSQLNVKPKSEKQHQQKLQKSEPVVAEWSTPIPFKKVNSTPSNFSSFFTTQTQNTTSSSQFWEQVEEFSDPTYSKSNDGNNNIRMKQNISTNVGKSEKEKDEYFESHQHNRLSSEKGNNNIQHPQFQQEQQQQPATQYVMEETKPTSRSSNKKSRSTSSPKKSPRSSSGKDNSGLESINEDEISNAFSLQLPMNKGGFDEISLLQMNDSATVYFQQQLNGGVADDNAAVGDGNFAAAANFVDTDQTNDADNYWKQKFLELQQKTEALELSKRKEDHAKLIALQQHHELLQKDSQELEQEIMDLIQDENEEEKLVELDEIVNQHTPATDAQHLQQRDKKGADVYGSLEETYDTPAEDNTQQTESILNENDENQRQRLERCTSPLDVFEGINQFLDGVVDYNGGKKGRLERDTQKPQRITVASVGNKCASDVALSKEEVVHTMKKTAEGMISLVHKIEESKSGKKVKRELQKGKAGCNTEIQRMCATEMQDIANDLMRPEGIDSSANQCNATSLPVQCNDLSEQNENDVRFDASFETDEDLADLRPIGFVPLESDNGTSQRPNYVMDDGDNDVALLKSWNNSRKVTSPKSLADDLTAGASRLSHGVTSASAVDTEQSELSENAKMIFQAALKYDMKTLNAVKRFNNSRSSSPAQRGDRGGDGGVSVQHSEQPGHSLSRLSSPGSNFSSNIPHDFATWFELPSPGSFCIPLLPLLNVSLRNSIDIFDSSELSPKFRADDVANLSYADFVSQLSHEILMGNDEESDIFKQSMGPIIADGDDGSVRFANASIHLTGISNAAIAAISRRDFGDAMDIYNTLLRSCQTSKLGLVGQLIASTLHNLSVLHLWNQEYEQALQYCRESLRMKNELSDDGGSVNQWATMGLVNYATDRCPSALAAFRKANQMASKFYPDGNLTGRLVNNMACVNFDIGKLPLVQSQFKQALQLQKGDGNDEIGNTDISFSGGADLFSLSLTLFNLGVVFAAQNENQGAAASHLKASYAIQQALLESNSEVIRSTAYYIDSMKNYSPASTSKLAPKKSEPILSQAVTQKRTSDHQYTEPQADNFVQQEEEGERGNQYLEQEKTEPQQLRSNAQPLPSPANVFTTRASQRNPFIQEDDQISHPMLCLGSLRVTQSAAQRVQFSLEGCPDNPSSILHGVGRARDFSLLCRRPPISSLSSHRTVSQNIINYGLHTIKKREAQSELQKNLERYGPRHPEVGKSHNSLGLVYLFSENYTEAVAHFEASIRINSNALGPKHQDVASTLMFKGIAQLALEHLDDSLMSMRLVRRNREEFLGQKHPEIGPIINNIACVQYELGEVKTAELLFQEALDLQRKSFSTDPTFLKGVSIVLCNIAFLHAKCGEFPKALIELEGALQIRQDILLEDNTLREITENMAYILATHQLQHGAYCIEEITEEYITMLSNKSGVNL